jgi:hypothetical protein
MADSTGVPEVIEGDNISVAWAKAFCEAMKPGGDHSLIVTFPVEGDGLDENTDIREALDAKLREIGKSECQTVANTIFPWTMWNPRRDRDQLFERYKRAWSRIKLCPANRNGTYFRRMTAWGWNEDERFNQLDHIVKTWRAEGTVKATGKQQTVPNRRHTALQAAIHDPRRDHNHSRQHGFPCLQQVAFTPLGKKGSKGLAVNAFYPTQLIFDKAYGNYLGLYRLGRFMAHGMGLKLARVTCRAVRATYSYENKGPLRDLKRLALSIIQ